MKKLLAAIALLMLFAAPALACPFCRDAVAGSSAQVQKGFRRAVPVLGVPAVFLFGGMVWVGFRGRQDGAVAD